jgi:uncharacterized protein
MPIESRSTRPARIPSSALFAFVGITFLITWGLIGVYIVFPDAAAAWFGEISGSHPFFFLATWSPAIAAFVIVFLYSGVSGVWAFLSRLFLWRCPAEWVAFILIGLPLVFVAGSLLKGGPILALLPPEGIGVVVAVLFMMLFLGPIEEFGWRGVAQPLLQRHMAPIWAGLADRRDLGGVVAPASVLPGQHRIRRLEFSPVLRRQRGAGGAGDADLQPDARQPALADALPLATHQPVLAGRAALGHRDPRRRGGHRRVVEP